LPKQTLIVGLNCAEAMDFEPVINTGMTGAGAISERKANPIFNGSIGAEVLFRVPSPKIRSAWLDRRMDNVCFRNDLVISILLTGYAPRFQRIHPNGIKRNSSDLAMKRIRLLEIASPIRTGSKPEIWLDTSIREPFFGNVSKPVMISLARKNRRALSKPHAHQYSIYTSIENQLNS